MKVKLNINGKEVEVTLTPEQIADIEAQKKPKKFEFKYIKPFYLSDRDISTGIGCDTESIKHGRYRLTKEVAEQSLARNQRANRLEALAEQLGGLKEFAVGEENYCIYFEVDLKWVTDYCKKTYNPERVYMTKECAEEICRMLNEGEFSLEGNK